MQVRTVHDLAAVAKGRRTTLGLSQSEIAERAGVSRKWLSDFESGKPTAELGLALNVIHELGLELDINPAHDLPLPGLDLDRVIEEHRRR